MKFNNLNELAKHLGSSSGTKNLLSQGSIRTALLSEAERLQRYLVEEIDSYYNSYQPVEYKRTGRWLESIQVNPVIQVGNTYSISITFDDLAYHDSLFGGEQGYVPWLFEVGWHWSDDKQPRIPRLSDFEGIHYIKRSVERWNLDNKFGFKIYVYHNGVRYI